MFRNYPNRNKKEIALRPKAEIDPALGNAAVIIHAHSSAINHGTISWWPFTISPSSSAQIDRASRETSISNMFQDGTYTAWFRTSRGQGTATVHLADGTISGGDSFFHYNGSYQVEGDHFTATLTTKRFADGPTTVFGLDEVELKLTGTLNGTIARCAGTSMQVPDLPFEAMLFLGQEEAETQPAPPRPISPSNLARLPKDDGGRSRARNPFLRSR
jgi:hypothetical protein